MVNKTNNLMIPTIHVGSQSKAVFTFANTKNGKDAQANLNHLLNKFNHPPSVVFHGVAIQHIEDASDWMDSLSFTAEEIWRCDCESDNVHIKQTTQCCKACGYSHHESSDATLQEALDYLVTAS